MYKKNSAFNVAKRDISADIRSQKLKIKDNYKDVWVVTPHRIATKTTIRLNRELGLHKVNFHKGNMNRYKKN